MNRKVTWLLMILVWGGVLQTQAQDDAYPDALKLWYNQPADDWNEALPVGNGRLGAMIFGGIHQERLQLNEETVWTGKDFDFVNPAAKGALSAIREMLFEGKYDEARHLAQQTMMGEKTISSSYQTLGDLWLDFSNDGMATNYYRSLDLETAVAVVRYASGGVNFLREIFSSSPDQALVMKLTADKPEAISFSARLSRPGAKATLSVSKGEIVMYEHVGDGVGVKMVARLRVLNEGGTIHQVGNDLKIENANAVTLYLTAATDYWGDDPNKVSQDQMMSVEQKQYEQIRQTHIEDYQQYFNRVSLDLGTTESVYFSTDNRLEAMKKGNIDPHLLTLYYQYGRYLLISSSRPGGLPANLQGIWADGLTPPWSADYHININIQMNYWPAEITNLSEMHEPFLVFLDKLRPDGRKTAKDMYGINGAVAHFTTDAWHFTEPYGETQWAMWPMGLAWSAQHLWEHFLFTEDANYLKTLGYPVMKEAAEFSVNWLVEDPATKLLVSGPSISPENTFKTKKGKIATMVMGPTMDHMIIRELLTNTIAASKVLNKDANFRRRLEKVLLQLTPTKIGQDGRIMEWTEEFEEPEPGHRHISHLYGLHPGNQITMQNNPELMDAARKTIDYRLAHGGGHTGWSRAWIINFFARLYDGEEAYDNLIKLLQQSTLPNLFDTHPPFQIDGNFGATAGITEMLLQSHAGEIHLLPALPEAWSHGHAHGLVARGGFVIDQDWEDGQLKQLKLRSKLGNDCKIRYGDNVITLATEQGKAYTFNGELKPLPTDN